MNKKTFVLRDNEVKKRCIDTIQALNPSTTWEVTIKEYKRNRSKSQNALYWLWLKIIGDELGYTKDEMHIVLATRLLQPVIVEAMGDRIEAVRSTTTLKTAEFTEYLNYIEVFATGELGIRLLHPEALYHEAMGIRV